jgi:hypothetical protein
MHHLLHHANCADGFAAACIARHALLSQGLQETYITIQPVNYGWPQQVPESFAPGDDVTYLDYTPQQDAIDALISRNAHLTIIDHHASAAGRHGRDKDTGLPRADLRLPLFNSWFNLQTSGATLAWNYFMNTPSERAPDLPRAIELIQWRDLGHAFDPINAEDPRTADSLNLHAYLFRCLPRTFDAWTPLLLSTDSVHSVCSVGQRLRRIDQSIILSAVASPHWLNFHGEEIPAVNGLDAGLVSDACTALLKAYPTAPFAASWFIDPKSGKAVYSLRSRRDSAINVAEIAAAFDPDGGGHPNAAGFHTAHPIPFV